MINFKLKGLIMKNNFLKSVAVLFAIVFLSMANFNNHIMAQTSPIDDDIIFEVPDLETLKEALGDNAYLLDEMQNGWLKPTQLVAPADIQPSQGPWNYQKPLELGFKIDDCEYKFIVHWQCRVGFDGNPEIQILKLDVYAKTKECKDLILRFQSEILDHVVYKLFTHKSNDTNFRKCFSNLVPDSLVVKPCKDGYTSVFRVNVYLCGKKVTYKTKFDEVTTFVPCGVTTFCRLKYRYCYYIENGKRKIKSYVEPEKYNDYGCPPHKEIRDPEGNVIELDCRDHGCSNRPPKAYEVITKPIVSLEELIGVSDEGY